jgi:predicted nucleic acid-binding protein
MTKLVLLDAGPLGLITHPKRNPEIKAWLDDLIEDGIDAAIPEVADYEVRRELIRASRTGGLRLLDALKARIDYLPLTTETMLKAAEYWAQARRRGRPTAGDQALDCDVILAAQAALVLRSGQEVVIATTNVGHLAQFVEARRWEEITLDSL